MIDREREKERDRETDTYHVEIPDTTYEVERVGGGQAFVSLSFIMLGGQHQLDLHQPRIWLNN